MRSQHCFIALRARSLTHEETDNRLSNPCRRCLTRDTLSALQEELFFPFYLHSFFLHMAASSLTFFPLVFSMLRPCGFLRKVGLGKFRVRIWRNPQISDGCPVWSNQTGQSSSPPSIDRWLLERRVNFLSIFFSFLFFWATRHEAKHVAELLVVNLSNTLFGLKGLLHGGLRVACFIFRSKRILILVSLS